MATPCPHCACASADGGNAHALLAMLAADDLDAALAQRAGALFLRQRHADHAVGAGHAQGHRTLLGQLDRVIVDRAGLATADVQHQLGDALDVLHRQLRVHTTLEAVTGIG